MDDEIWEYYRREAMLWAAKRDQAIRNSRQAYKCGDGSKAKTESNYGKFCGQQCDEANKSAANAIFIQMNENRPLTEIDLHGLFVKEAIERLEDRVIYALNNHMQQLDVIVGQGHHSEGGAKLKPSVMEFAEENGIRYRPYEHNPGCIKFQFTQIASTRKTVYVQRERFTSNGRNRGRADDLSEIEHSIPTTPRFNEPSSGFSVWWIIAFFILALWLLSLDNKGGR